ncbi:serine/threonine protein kinase [Nocardia seriolae]|uniref:Serine/threonine protein kinase n=2 Tax=Nocardia seriolae TaxID=37332 RepID=A0ABC9YYX8_9NOCA|nr:hypothetical protein NS14008_13710 [Nocardia seriolae]GEM26394.1 hypothetical protein NS2_46330 [Nocardia seriolae NBRC 15557]BAW06273.1 conserved hypothetical protein [Nocardia seriolae]BEK87605.1 hypothetical protein NSERKGN1266_35560 [Nocardia seriolae]GAM48778.1 serine/threonine protein kinase [Nocardia seriolae]
MTEDIAPREMLDKLPPAYVAGVVGYLMSDECADTATVLVAGGGRVYRVRQFQNKGAVFVAPPSIDEVAAQWDRITDMSGAEPGANPLG